MQMNCGIEERNTIRRFFTHALASGIVFGALLMVPLSKPLPAADDAPTFRQADHSLAEALANGDKKTVAGLLDERFKDEMRPQNQPAGICDYF